MASGTIVRIVMDRGFGFIKPDDGGADIFFHHSSLAEGGFDGLQEGQAVEFDTGRDPRSDRPRATNVRPI
jgi:CspA family cold shock protein